MPPPPPPPLGGTKTWRKNRTPKKQSLAWPKPELLGWSLGLELPRTSQWHPPTPLPMMRNNAIKHFFLRPNETMHYWTHLQHYGLENGLLSGLPNKDICQPSKRTLITLCLTSDELASTNKSCMMVTTRFFSVSGGMTSQYAFITCKTPVTDSLRMFGNGSYNSSWKSREGGYLMTIQG